MVTSEKGITAFENEPVLIDDSNLDGMLWEVKKLKVHEKMLMSGITQAINTLFEEFKKIQTESKYCDRAKMPLMYGGNSLFKDWEYFEKGLCILYSGEGYGNTYTLFIPAAYNTKESILTWFKGIVKSVEDEAKKDDEDYALYLKLKERFGE